MKYYLSKNKQEEIYMLYNEGFSPPEIKEKLGLKLAVRTLQRWLKFWGISRTAGDAYRLAVSQGKVTYHYTPNKKKRKTINHKLRTFILERDQYTCVKCGNTKNEERIQIDHIDNNPSNDSINNLETLCEPCNKGKIRRRVLRGDSWVEEEPMFA